MLTACSTVPRLLSPFRVRMLLSGRTATYSRSIRFGRHHPPHRSVRQHAAQAGFPTWAERNQRLGQSLKELVSDSQALTQLKQHAALLRSGGLPAEDFVREFRRICGSQPEATAVLLDLAALLPSREQQLALQLACQGAAVSAPQTDSQPAGNSVAGIMRSVAAAPAGEMASQGAGATAPAEASGAAEQTPVVAASDADDLEAAADSSVRATAGAVDLGAGKAAVPAVEDMLDSSWTASHDSRPAKPARGRKKQRREAEEAAANQAEPANGRPGALVWLRQDLRLHDNAAVAAAAAQASAAGGTLTLAFVHSPEEDGDDFRTGTSWRPAGATLVWLHHALASLDADLRSRHGPGAGIVYRHGPYASSLVAIAEAAAAGVVHFSRRYEPAMQSTDESVATALRAAGLQVEVHPGYLLYEPADVRIDMRGRWCGHFGTLTPFHRACEKLPKLSAPLPPPAKLPVSDVAPAERCGGVALEALGLARMPVRADGAAVDWGSPLMAAWRCTEDAAIQALDEFLDIGFRNYEASRQFADARAVSRLSPFLHFGQLSPRLVIAEARKRGGMSMSKTFMRRLVWRDLSYWQLHHWPAMALHPIRKHYGGQVWREDAAMLAAWQSGATGFPLVDAGMRQLWATGWMQQSVRMVCAAFLTEYLSISWVEGCRWFHDTLVDADLAINSMMWQNAGKAGLDQWNFTLLPTSRSQDPDGSYTRRWVPELAKLPNKYMHAPWDAPPATLAAAGVELGKTYPERIIKADVQELRMQNMAAIKVARRQHKETCSDADGYDLIAVPEGAVTNHASKKIRIFTKQEYRRV